MAPKKSRRSKPGKPSQNIRKPKAKQVVIKAKARAVRKPPMKSGVGRPLPHEPRLAVERPDFPCSFSLSNLVRLDWERRQDLFPHGPGISKLERLGFKGRTYNVEALEFGDAGNTFVYLYPEKHYYIVPIFEGNSAATAPQRFLLIRGSDDQKESGPHIFVVAPLEPPALDGPFAHLHIIGGEDDLGTPDLLRQTAGIVEAVLTATDMPPQPAPPATPVVPMAAAPTVTAPLQPTSPVVSAVVEPWDKELLDCIDVLAIAQASRPDAAKDFEAAHNKFLRYVQKRYGLESIPIILGQTKFDPALGHSAATTVNNPILPEGVIVSVLQDGYRRGPQIVRDAHVVVNKPDTATASKPSPTTQPTPEPRAPSVVKPQGVNKSDEDLLPHIDNFNQARARIAGIRNLVPLSRQQLYLEFALHEVPASDEAVQEANEQVAVIDALYSLLAIFAFAAPAKIRIVTRQLSTQPATSEFMRSMMPIPLLETHLRRTPEITAFLKGNTKVLDALKDILTGEARQRRKTTISLPRDRPWLNEVLRQLRADGPTTEAYKKFAEEIARRLEQIAFTPELAANTSK
jgi:molecular chaperone GrpE (heat shock protein)